MRKVIWLAVLAALVLGGRAEAQGIGCTSCGLSYTPASGSGGGVTGLTSDGVTITSTLPIILPAGTTAAPSLGFTGSTNTGFSLPGAGAIYFSSSGALRISFATSLTLGSGGSLLWNSDSALGGSNDLILGREAAATLQHGADSATATAQTIKGPDSTGATIAGASLTLKAGAGTSGIANGGALILAGGANSSTGEPGAVAISDGGTKPTCAAGIRGSIWYDAAAAGALDTFEVCRKAADNSYAWVSLF